MESKLCNTCMGLKIICINEKACPWLKIKGSCDSCWARKNCPECNSGK